MWNTVFRAVISTAVLLTVAEVSQRMPRLGALLLSLPLVSILALTMAWTRFHDLASVSQLAYETIILVPLGLPFFLPLAFAGRLGIGFWSAGALGVALASATIGTYLMLAAKPS